MYTEVYRFLTGEDCKRLGIIRTMQIYLSEPQGDTFLPVWKWKKCIFFFIKAVFKGLHSTQMGIITLISCQMLRKNSSGWMNIADHVH